VGKGGKVAQTMCTDVSKCKNNKINFKKEGKDKRKIKKGTRIREQGWRRKCKKGGLNLEKKKHLDHVFCCMWRVRRERLSPGPERVMVPPHHPQPCALPSLSCLISNNVQASQLHCWLQISFAPGLSSTASLPIS
jgi:hypothetical protein